MQIKTISHFTFAFSHCKVIHLCEKVMQCSLAGRLYFCFDWNTGNLMMQSIKRTVFNHLIKFKKNGTKNIL